MNHKAFDKITEVEMGAGWLCELCGALVYLCDVRGEGHDVLHTGVNSDLNLCLGCAWSNPEDVCRCCGDRYPQLDEWEYVDEQRT